MLQQSHETGETLILPELSSRMSTTHSDCGAEMKFSGVEAAEGLPLAALRALVAGVRKSATITIRPVGDGYGIHYEVTYGRSGWLLSDHTKEIRGFARAETAFKVCRQLGLDRVTVFFGSTERQQPVTASC